MGVSLTYRIQAACIDFREETQKIVVQSDKLRLQQLLINLQSNAIKFTKKCGAVAIICTFVPGDQRFAKSPSKKSLLKKPQVKSKILSKSGMDFFDSSPSSSATDSASELEIDIKRKLEEMMQQGPTSKLVIEVRDTGIGIKPRDQKHLFKMFGKLTQTSQQNTNQVGLGLFTCSQIVEQFGGRVLVKSEYAQGSSFFFSFELQAGFIRNRNLQPEFLSLNVPSQEQILTDEDFRLPTIHRQPSQLLKVNFRNQPHFGSSNVTSPLQRINQPMPLREQPVRERRLMMVDDEPFNIQALMGLLGVLKMSRLDLVDVCYNGEESVRLMETAIQQGDVDRYSLILTDMSMPFMDGYKASQRIRRIRRLAMNLDDDEEDRTLTIMAITGHVEPEYIEKAKKSGVNEVFAKPISAMSLGQILLDHGFIRSIPASVMRSVSDSE